MVYVGVGLAVVVALGVLYCLYKCCCSSSKEANANQKKQASGTQQFGVAPKHTEVHCDRSTHTSFRILSADPLFVCA
jgi:hypothetical protein